MGSALKWKIVILSNADVVFDDSLSLVDSKRLLTGGIGYVLSVKPPPENTQYEEVFGTECRNTPRCVVGAWDGGEWGQMSGGGSWDTYIFAPPLANTLNFTHLDLVMNIEGAENRAAFELEINAGLTLFNPCIYVNAFHWHCGGKMHALGDARADQLVDCRQVRDILPCLECPGVGLPMGQVQQSALCQTGLWQRWPQIASLVKLFHHSWEVQVCCARDWDCARLDVAHAPRCVRSRDVNCVTWTTGEHMYYYPEDVSHPCRPVQKTPRIGA